MKEVLTVILFVFYIFHFKSLIRGEASVTLSLIVQNVSDGFRRNTNFCSFIQDADKFVLHTFTSC
jgi:hypothetical protein